MVMSCDGENPIRNFLFTIRCQKMLTAAAAVSAIGQCVVVIVWLSASRPPDQRLTFLALLAITLVCIYMLAGLFLWITMFWFTLRYLRVHAAIKAVLATAEIISFGWLIPVLVYLFAYRPHIRSMKTNQAASTIRPRS